MIIIVGDDDIIVIGDSLRVDRLRGRRCCFRLVRTLMIKIFVVVIIKIVVVAIIKIVVVVYVLIVVNCYLMRIWLVFFIYCYYCPF